MHPITKRTLIGGIFTLPFISGKAEAQANKSYTVPDGVKRIRVQSFIGDKTVMDTTFKVVPGQKFVFDAVGE